MTTGLWPALLAALLGSAGRGGLHDGSGSASLGELRRGLSDAAASVDSFLGSHALYWWLGFICFVAVGEYGYFGQISLSTGKFRKFPSEMSGVAVTCSLHALGCIFHTSRVS